MKPFVKLFSRSGLMLAAIFCYTMAIAQQGTDPDPKNGLSIEPLMLEAKGGTGNVFGVNVQYKKSWEKIGGFDELLEKKLPNRAADAKARGLISCGGFAEEDRPVPTWVSFTDCAGEVSGSGTVTADADKNPNKLLDLSGSYSWIYTSASRAGSKMFALGGQGKFETDQSFDNKQFVYGLRGTFTHLAGCAASAGRPCGSMNFLGLAIGVQRVDPSKDQARKTALAGAAMDNYQRIEFEGFYKLYLPKEWRYLSDIEFNYRHFQELSPDVIIRQAGLDRHRLGLMRLNFGWGGTGATAVDPSMFIQFTRGSLPFDTKSEHVVKVGLEFKVF